MDSWTSWYALKLASISKRYNKHLTNLIFSVRTVIYSSLFTPLQFIYWNGENEVCNLQYGSQLIRGVDESYLLNWGINVPTNILNPIRKELNLASFWGEVRKREYCKWGSLSSYSL